MGESLVTRLVSRAALIVLVAVMASGCATSFDKRGRYHRVRTGESVWRIAKVYRVDVQQLAEYNNILEPGDVKAGMQLYIPPKANAAGFKKLPFGEAGTTAQRSGGTRRGRSRGRQQIRTFRGRFIWPVDGRLTSPFGMRNGRRHDGIDIGARTGTPIRASDAGRVAFAGKMRGYGNIILLRHKDDFFTAYAHNHRNKVRKGQIVKKGQTIGTVGRTGRASGSHLHFEIRHGQTARNPLFFLPERKG